MKPAGLVGFLLLYLLGEFVRFVEACALDLHTAQHQLRFEKIGLDAQGVLQRFACASKILGNDLSRGELDPAGLPGPAGVRPVAIAAQCVGGVPQAPVGWCQGDRWLPGYRAGR